MPHTIPLPQLGPAARLACAGALLAAAAPALAAPDLSGSVSIGGEYDSNVAVDEADINTRRGDASLLFYGSLDLQLVDTDKITLDLSYTFDQSLHDDLTAFDLQMHGIGGSASVTLDGNVFGFDGGYRRARLGGDDYLGMLIISPSITRRLSDRLIFRASYTGQQKHFVDSVRLDAWNDLGQVDLYRYFAKRRGVVVASFRIGREDAAADELDYHAWQAGLRTQFPLAIGDFATRLRAGYAFSKRDYDSVTPSIGEVRRERRSTISAAWDVPVGSGLTLRPALRLVDRHSNLPSADYFEHVVSTELEYEF